MAEHSLFTIVLVSLTMQLR